MKSCFDRLSFASRRQIGGFYLPFRLGGSNPPHCRGPIGSYFKRYDLVLIVQFLLDANPLFFWSEQVLYIDLIFDKVVEILTFPN